MAESKKVSIALGEKGIIAYAVVKREADGYILDDTDGAFKLAPADPYLSVPEDAVYKGYYEATESRTVWVNGRYIALVYKQAGGSPDPATDDVIGYGETFIKDDKEVLPAAQDTVDAVKVKTDALPADPASQAKLDFIQQWILNKLVVEDTQIILYDDNGTTPLKTWPWNATTKTRGAAT